MVGDKQLGDTIKIYKDSSLVSLTLEDKNDSGKEGQFLKYVYLNNSGTTAATYVDVSILLSQSEFGNGLQVSNAGVVSIKIDDKASNSDSFLQVGKDGLSLTGVSEAIETASEAITNIIGDGFDTGNTITSVITSIQNSLSNVNVTSTGKTINVVKADDGAEFNVEVNTKTLTDDEKNQGLIEFKNDGGALYGVMYYGGDDAE